MDGTLLEAWASLKSYRPRDDQDPPPGGGRNQAVDFRGQRRRSDTHTSTTDPEARLYKRAPGQVAKLSYLGHVLMENRHGLVVDVALSEANGRAEREAALQMVERRTAGRATLGADRGYDVRGFVKALRSLGVTPHLARNDRRGAVPRPPPRRRMRAPRSPPAGARGSSRTSRRRTARPRC